MSLILAISQDVGLSRQDIITICRTAPHRYKVYEIKKRSGRGTRIIAQPAPEVKLVQRWVVEHALSALPIHTSCMGYVKGINIRDNAQMHVENSYLLKMDFRSFFPSIVPNDLSLHLSCYAPDLFNAEEVSLLRTLLFWKNKKQNKLQLSIGAPSSPMISNTIMYGYDLVMHKYCSDNDVVYTRYADDLTFSSSDKDILKHVYEYVVKLVSKLEYPALSINSEKTIFASKKGRRMVTGLVLDNSGKVSLGRERKRLIRAQVNRFQKGVLDYEKVQELKGYLSFAIDIEPEYVQRLIVYYGEHVMNGLISQNAMSRIKE